MNISILRNKEVAKVAVIILNYNGVLFLKQFLPGVIKNSVGSEIWVADNASTDDSMQYLREYHPDVNRIELEENTGYAGGYFEALERIKAEYYVLLNSDVEVSDNWVQPIIKLMDNDESIAACQPKIKSYSDKSLFEYAGASGGFIDRYGYPFCRGRIFDTLEEDKTQYDDAIEVFWATGACLFLRSKAYHEVGGLDIDFFAHMEEIDLCWRLKNRGYKIMCEPKSIVYHVGGGTLQKSNPKKTYLNFRNSLFTLAKNHPKKGLVSVLIFRLLLDGLAGIKFLISFEFANIWAILKAHFSFYRSYSITYKKRQNQDFSSPLHVYQASIVFQYYLKGKKNFNDLTKLWS